MEYNTEDKRNRKLVIFDLDETLVHAFTPQTVEKSIIERLRQDMQNRNEVAKQSQMNSQIYNQPHMFVMLKGLQQVKWLEPADKLKVGEVEYVVVLRPYLIAFLAKIYKENKFDMGVFSMGSQEYVDCILNAISEKVCEFLKKPSAQIFKTKHYRHDARTHDDEDRSMSKDLSVVRGAYNIKHMILIDNVSANFASNVNNCAPIRPFTLQSMYTREFGVDQSGNPTFAFDMGLVRLEVFLKHINLQKSIQDQNIFVYIK